MSAPVCSHVVVIQSSGVSMDTIFSQFCIVTLFVCVFFFFQAEDGIRDRDVTGVQTCALPILRVITRGVSSFVDTILESAVGAWLFWIVTVVVAEPVLVAESVKQMRIVLAPTLRSLPLIVTFVVFGDVEYVPELSWVPSEQFVPPFRTLYVPFSLACQVIVELPAELIVDGFVE